MKKNAASTIGEMSFLDSMDGLGSSSSDGLDALDGLNIDDGGRVDHYKKVKYTGKAEKDTKAELTAVQQTFRDARKRETEQRQDMMDVGFYFCVVFESAEQKAEFLKKLAIRTDVDEHTMFLNGFDLAKKLGIKLKTPRVKWNNPRNDSSWADELGVI